MFFSRRTGSKYVDRDPPENPDFDQTDLDAGTDWADLDLSGIIPLGTKLVKLAVNASNDIAAQSIYFRTKGSTYYNAGDGLTIQFTDRSIAGNISLPCDSNRIIQVKKGAGNWASAAITVKGWFK